MIGNFKIATHEDMMGPGIKYVKEEQCQVNKDLDRLMIESEWDSRETLEEMFIIPYGIPKQTYLAHVFNQLFSDHPKRLVI